MRLPSVTFCVMVCDIVIYTYLIKLGAMLCCMELNDILHIWLRLYIFSRATLQSIYPRFLLIPHDRLSQCSILYRLTSKLWRWYNLLLPFLYVDDLPCVKSLKMNIWDNPGLLLTSLWTNTRGVIKTLALKIIFDTKAFIIYHMWPQKNYTWNPKILIVLN